MKNELNRARIYEAARGGHLSDIACHIQDVTKSNTKILKVFFLQTSVIKFTTGHRKLSETVPYFESWLQ